MKERRKEEKENGTHYRAWRAFQTACVQLLLRDKAVRGRWWFVLWKHFKRHSQSKTDMCWFGDNPKAVLQVNIFILFLHFSWICGISYLRQHSSSSTLETENAKYLLSQIFLQLWLLHDLRSTSRLHPPKLGIWSQGCKDKETGCVDTMLGWQVAAAPSWEALVVLIVLPYPAFKGSGSSCALCPDLGIVSSSVAYKPGPLAFLELVWATQYI